MELGGKSYYYDLVVTSLLGTRSSCLLPLRKLAVLWVVMAPGHQLCPGGSDPCPRVPLPGGLRPDVSMAEPVVSHPGARATCCLPAAGGQVCRGASRTGWERGGSLWTPSDDRACLAYPDRSTVRTADRHRAATPLALAQLFFSGTGPFPVLPHPDYGCACALEA